MKPFKFPLESLQTLREQKERVAQQRYSRSLEACETAAEQLKTAETELTGGWEWLQHELGSGAEASKIMGLRGWCLALESKRNERHAALDEVNRAAKTAFNDLLKATRERKALDRFYARSRQAHALARQREEQKQLDELAVQMSGAVGLLQPVMNEN